MLGSTSRWLLLSVVGCLLLCGFAAGGEMERVNGRRVVSGRLLVRFAAEAERAAAGDFKTLGFRFARAYRLARAQLWHTPKGLSVARAMRIARRIPGLVALEPDYLRTVAQVPDDPKYRYQYAPAKMDLPQAWDLTTGTNVIVAVIDTGVQYDHPDLAGNIYANPSEVLDGIDNDGNGYVDDIHGWDFVGRYLGTPQNDNDPSDFNGHGTKVAGVIGAVGNNALGVAGVAWKVRILPLKIGEDSSTPNLSAAASIEAIEYAVAQGAQVINASYTSDTYSHFELEAVQAAQEAGVIVVNAAGNGSSSIDDTPAYPGSYNLANIISVAASTSSDSLASWSNYGPVYVDLAAPGSGIYTTAKTNTYSTVHGTSFSSPQIAGIAALIRAAFPKINVRKLRLMIMEGADKVASHSGKTVTSGRANAFSALRTMMPWSKRYYETLPEPLSIPDNDPTGITRTVTVTDDRIIRDLAVIVEVDHPWMGDVSLSIESPSGTVNTLKSPGSDDNAGFHHIFDTQWDFRGEPAAGVWSLTVADEGPDDKGHLLSWGLEIHVDGYNEDLNGDGRVNIIDLILIRNALNTSCGRHDVNRDGFINIIDIIRIRNRLGTSEYQ